MAVACIGPKEKGKKRGVAKGLANNRLIITGGNIKEIIASSAKIITNSNIILNAIYKQ